MRKQYTESGIDTLLAHCPTLSQDSGWWERIITEDELRTIIRLSLRAPCSIEEYLENNRFDDFHATLNRFLDQELPQGDICSLASGTGAREVWLVDRASRRRFFHLSDLFYHEYLMQCRPIFISAGCADSMHLATEPVNVTALPYPDQMFDGLFAGSVLYALNDSEVVQMLSEVHRVLKHGGTAVIWCYSYITPLDRLRAWVRRLPFFRRKKLHIGLKHCGYMRTRSEMDRLFNSVPGLCVRRFFRIGHKLAPHTGSWIGSLLTLADYRAGGYVVESLHPRVGANRLNVVGGDVK